MIQYIDKDALVAEIERRRESNAREKFFGRLVEDNYFLDFLNTLEVKEVGLELTWEDVRELYIIFAEVDVEIELCKTDDIQAETIGYYQEVLKRFKERKGE